MDIEQVVTSIYFTRFVIIDQIDGSCCLIHRTAGWYGGDRGLSGVNCVLIQPRDAACRDF